MTPSDAPSPGSYVEATELFLACLVLDEGDRDALLERECAHDPALRARVEDMLRQDGDGAALTGPGGLAIGSGDPTAAIVAVLDGAEQLPRRLGPYRLIRRLGSGGFGTVYEAIEEHPRRHLALKLLHPWLASGDVLERFRGEANLLASLDHPGLPHVYGAGVIDEAGERVVYLALELVRGERLDTWAAKEKLRARIEILALIAETVDAVHKEGIVHRDLKPSNILIDGSGRPKVLDFGTARLGVGTGMTRMGELVGTLSYMSPEQLTGQTRVDPRTDVYALGVIAYQILTGRHPQPLDDMPLAEAVAHMQRHEPPSPANLVPATAGDLEQIVLKALRREPDARYSHAGELAADLRRCLRGEVVLARPVPVTVQAWRWSRRNPPQAALAAVVAAALLVAAATLVWFGRYQGRVADEAQRLLVSERAARVRADGLRLAARSTTVGDEDQTLALLLAIEAGETAPGSEANHALYQALAGGRELLTLDTGHYGTMRGAQYASSGQLIVSLADEPEFVVWDASSGALRYRLGDIHAPVTTVVGAASSARAASVHVDGTLRLWDLDSGRTVAEEIVDGAVDVIALSPDGASVAYVPGIGGGLELRAADLTLIRRIAAPCAVSNLLFVGDGERVIGVDRDGWAWIWDVATGSELARIDLGDGIRWKLPETIAASHDGGRLLTVVHAPGEGARLWESATGRLLLHRERASVATITADGQRLVALDSTSGSDRIAQTWFSTFDASSGRQLAKVLLPYRLGRVALSPQGDLAAFVSAEGRTIELLESTTGISHGRLAGHQARIRSIVFDSDGERVLTSADDRSVRVWSVAEPNRTRLPVLGDGDEVVLAYVPTRDVVVTSHRRDTCRLTVREVASGRVLHTADGSRCVAQTSPGGRYLAVSAAPAWALLDLDRHETVRTWTDATSRCRFNRTGTRLALFDYHWPPGEPEPVRIFDTEDGRLVARIAPLRDYAGAEVSPDGRLLATADRQSCSITMYTIADGLEQRQVSANEGWAIDVAWSADGSRLASWAMDGAVVWDTVTGTPVAIDRRQPGAEARLEFAPDGRRILARLTDELRLLDAARSDAPPSILPWSHGAISAAGFTADGDWVWAVGSDGTVRHWPVEPLPMARRRASRPLHHVELERFGIGSVEDRRRRQSELAYRGYNLHHLAEWAVDCQDRGDYAEALRAWLRIGEINPLHPSSRAGLLALHLAALASGDHSTGGVDAALAAVERYVELGATVDLDAAKFDPIRRHPRFVTLLGRD